MKIALLTYHHSVNYGAVLQTFATCKILSELGHSVTLVDIRQNERISKWKKIFFSVRNFHFNRFKKQFYPPLTKSYSSVSELKSDPPVADCYVVGSDQVWNPDIDFSKIEAYFLNYGPKNIKRISYASSFGKSKWTVSDYNLNYIIKNSVANFDAISVRESSGKEILKNMFDREAEIVLDPTLLLDTYDKFISKGNQKKEIVCYKLIRDKSFYETAKYISRALDLPLRLINNIYPIRGFKYVYPPSIETWLNYIFNSSFVITDSYHGVLFSIIFRKNFLAMVAKPERIVRLQNILSQLGLENRLKYSDDEIMTDSSWKEPIDYESVYKKLNNLRKKSMQFLINALS